MSKKCQTCKNYPEQTNRSRCNRCLGHARRATAKLRNKRKNANLCVSCGDKSLKGLKACFNCWLSTIGCAGSKKSSWSKEEISLLKIIWSTQKGRCIYTNKKLIPGVNASLDHIVPFSRGGKHVTHNVQFVTKTINKMKTTFTHGEFINACELITSRFHLYGMIK